MKNQYNIKTTERMVYMKEREEIGIKGCFEVLSLFFVLAVVSVIMIYGKFEQGVNDFWENRLYEDTSVEKEENEEIRDADNIETSGGVSDFYKNYLENQYIESNGEIDVFKEIFDIYW